MTNTMPRIVALILASFTGADAIQRTDNGKSKRQSFSWGGKKKNNEISMKDDDDIDDDADLAEVDVDNDGVPDDIQTQFKTFCPFWKVEFPSTAYLSELAAKEQEYEGDTIEAYSVAKKGKEVVVMIPGRSLAGGESLRKLKKNEAAGDGFFPFRGDWNLAALPKKYSYEVVWDPVKKANVQKEVDQVLTSSSSFIQTEAATTEKEGKLDGTQRQVAYGKSVIASFLGSGDTIIKKGIADSFEFVENNLQRAEDMAEVVDDAVTFIQVRKTGAQAIRDIARRLLMDKNKHVLNIHIKMDKDINNDGEIDEKDMTLKMENVKLTESPADILKVFANAKAPEDDTEEDDNGPLGFQAIMFTVNEEHLVNNNVKNGDLYFADVTRPFPALGIFGSIGKGFEEFSGLFKGDVGGDNGEVAAAPSEKSSAADVKKAAPAAPTAKKVWSINLENFFRKVQTMQAKINSVIIMILLLLLLLSTWQL